MNHEDYVGKWYQVTVEGHLVRFYVHRLSRTGGKVKIDHAAMSLRSVYGDGPAGGCTSIDLQRFREDLESGTIRQLTPEEVENYRDSGLMLSDMLADRYREDRRFGQDFGFLARFCSERELAYREEAKG